MALDLRHCAYRDIPGYEGIYQINGLGTVKSLKSGRWGSAVAFLSWTFDSKGYPRVSLYRDGKGIKKRVHSLVALAFLGVRPEGYEVRHLDGDSGNPRASNLVYGTSKENNADKYAHGTARIGSLVAGAKLVEENIPIIRRRIRLRHRIKDIAASFGVFPQRITDIKHGRTWRHI